MKENVPITDGPVWMVDPNWMQKTGGYAKDMTLRDHYAGLVLQGFAARDTHDAGLVTPEQRAKLAYIDADALLKERAK